MKIRSFGPAELPVPVLGQGTWNFERASEKQAIASLRAGIDAGMRHIDTAELYGHGRAERVVGRAIAGRRDDVFLVSKLLPSNAAYPAAIESCEDTLARLGTDHLDVYLLHWRGTTPLEQTFRAFDKLQAHGKIRAFGVSNFDIEDLEDALAITGLGRIVCNQVLYHLEERSIEHNVIPWCARQNISVVAYSPLGSGQFPAAHSPGGRVLAAVAEAREASVYQIALAFLIQRGGVFAIPKSATPTHTLENAAAGDLVLSDEELKAIDAAFPAEHKHGLPML